MSKLIAEEIVEAITLGDKEGFMSAFHSAIAAKVSDALEIKKVEIASTLIAPASSEVVEEEVEQVDEAGIHDFIGGVLSGKSDKQVAQDAARSLHNKMQLAQKTLPGYKQPDPKNQVGKKLGVKEEVDLDEAKHSYEPKIHRNGEHQDPDTHPANGKPDAVVDIEDGRKALVFHNYDYKKGVGHGKHTYVRKTDGDDDYVYHNHPKVPAEKVKQDFTNLDEEVEQIDELAPVTYWNAAEKRRNQAAVMKNMNRNDPVAPLLDRAKKLSNAGDERARDREYNAVQDAKKAILSPATRKSLGISAKHIFTKANGETAYDSMKKEEVEQIAEDKKLIAWKSKIIDKHGDLVKFTKEKHADANTYHTVARVKDKPVGNYMHTKEKGDRGAVFNKRGDWMDEEVEQIEEAAKLAAKELKVSFGRGHSGQPGGEGQSDTVTTHHGNGLKVKSSIGWDGDHSINVHHNGKHVGGIFSTHGSDSPRFEKNKKYTGEIDHKEVRTAMAAHQKHPEVQSWLIHNHSDSESEADTGTINGHKLHPTAKKYLEKISNDDNRDYEAPYRSQTTSAAKPKSAPKASTSGAYEKALAALKKKHGINEEAEEIEEAKGETRISWRSRTPEEIAKSDKRRKVKVTSAELEARARARRAEKSE